MKTNVTNMALAIVIVALGLVSLASLRAQPNTNPSRPFVLTTNWLGYLVAGQDWTKAQLVDRMPGAGPKVVPQAIPQFQIGLRSDGVVVWRAAPNTK